MGFGVQIKVLRQRGGCAEHAFERGGPRVRLQGQLAAQMDAVEFEMPVGISLDVRQRRVADNGFQHAGDLGQTVVAAEEAVFAAIAAIKLKARLMFIADLEGQREVFRLRQNEQTAVRLFDGARRGPDLLRFMRRDLEIHLQALGNAGRC